MSVSREVQILPTDTPARFEAAVCRAAELLRQGELVAVPTETVYGLAANALDARAVSRIFAVKGRPGHNPIIVHVASVAMARRCVAEWPALAGKLAKSFWPGPLTLVLLKAGDIPDLVTAGGPTVGVRWPAHPFVQALIRQCAFPLAAPSANLSNAISPTTAAHVRQSLGNRLPCIVDGGPSQVGIESTVLDLSVSPPRLLRPGMIHVESLLAVTGALEGQVGAGGGSLKSPGMLSRHYSPKARLLVLGWEDSADLRVRLAGHGCSPAGSHVIAHTRIPAEAGFGRVCVIPHDPPAFARALYAELHRCDEEGAEVIAVEALPEGPAWQALADRLRRAQGQGG